MGMKNLFRQLNSKKNLFYWNHRGIILANLSRTPSENPDMTNLWLFTLGYQAPPIKIGSHCHMTATDEREAVANRRDNAYYWRHRGDIIIVVDHRFGEFYWIGIFWSESHYEYGCQHRLLQNTLFFKTKKPSENLRLMYFIKCYINWWKFKNRFNLTGLRIFCFVGKIYKNWTYKSVSQKRYLIGIYMIRDTK